MAQHRGQSYSVQQPLTFTARLDSTERRAPVKIDVVGAENIESIRQLAGRVPKAGMASAAVYIRGTPEVVASALTQLADTNEIEQLNAALSLHLGESRRD